MLNSCQALLPCACLMSRQAWDDGRSGAGRADKDGKPGKTKSKSRGKSKERSGRQARDRDEGGAEERKRRPSDDEVKDRTAEMHAARAGAGARAAAGAGRAVAPARSGAGRQRGLLDPAKVFQHGLTGQLQGGHARAVYGCAYSPDGQIVASAGHDGHVVLWDLRRLAVKRTLKGHTGFVFGVAFSPDGERVLSAGSDSSARVWTVAGGKCEAVLGRHSDAVTCCAWAPTGKVLATGSRDQSIILWHVPPHGSIRVLAAIGGAPGNAAGHSDCVRGVAFSPSGAQLVSCSDDETIRVWSASEDGDLVRIMSGHTRTCGCAYLLLRGCARARCVTPSLPRRPFLLTHITLSSSVCRVVVAGTFFTDAVLQVAISPDGTRLASCSHDGTVRLWNYHSGAQLRVLKGGHTGYVRARIARVGASCRVARIRIGAL